MIDFCLVGCRMHLMRYFLLKMIAVFLLILIILLAIGFIRTWKVQYDKRNAVFLQGTFPDPLPDGFYNGDVGRKVSWKGKTFNSAASRGINVFENREKYPFITYPDQGLQEKNLRVLRIDYNLAENPFWLRLVVDEIVQVGSNEYLGKMHVRIIPGLPFAAAYFKLKK